MPAKKNINIEYFLFHIHSTENSLERNKGNIRKIGINMKNMEIYRKKSIMKMMVEHNFAGIPKGIYYFFKSFKIYMKLFQYIIIPGYI